MSDDGKIVRLRAESVTWRRVEDEVIVLDRRSWAYLSVNASGATLWELVVRGASRTQLIGALVDEYAVEPVRAAADVGSFLELLGEHDLLEG